jgi:hypothetical protein
MWVVVGSSDDVTFPSPKSQRYSAIGFEYVPFQAGLEVEASKVAGSFKLTTYGVTLKSAVSGFGVRKSA